MCHTCRRKGATEDVPRLVRYMVSFADVQTPNLANSKQLHERIELTVSDCFVEVLDVESLQDEWGKVQSNPLKYTP